MFLRNHEFLDELKTRPTTRSCWRRLRRKPTKRIVSWYPNPWTAEFKVWAKVENKFSFLLQSTNEKLIHTCFIAKYGDGRIYQAWKGLTFVGKLYFYWPELNPKSSYWTHWSVQVGICESVAKDLRQPVSLHAKGKLSLF